MMELLPLVGIWALLFVKEAGVPVPVPGDLVVIGAGVAATARPDTAPLVLGGILVAGYLGGTVQFLLVRGGLRAAALRVFARFGLGPDRLERLAERLRRSGWRGVAVARATPGLRIGSIAACGLAAIPLSVFARGLVVGNTAFVGAHFALGMAVGAPAAAIASRAGSVAALAVAGVAILALGGAAAWRILSRRRVRASPLVTSDPADFAAWADAGCPACLGMVLLRERGSDPASDRGIMP